jgi:GntR family transcriptional regulator/MocR family aminotransferase
MTMSLSRRLALLDWASRAGAWVVEDDYDSEYRYEGRPLASLQGLDADGRVIYLGTFSKVMFPSLRLGYMVVPAELVDAFIAARAVAGRHSPTVEQAVLTDFMEEGHFGRHIRRMRTLYRGRQAALIEALRREAGDLVEAEPSDAGLHLTAWLPEGLDDKEVARAAAARGVESRPMSSFYAQGCGRPALLLGYAAFDRGQLRHGAARLYAAARACLGGRRAQARRSAC